jgi:hypothetical protein
MIKKFLRASQFAIEVRTLCEAIRDIRPWPFGRDAVLGLIAVTLLSIAPLVLTVIPLEELIRKFLGAVS